MAVKTPKKLEVEMQLDIKGFMPDWQKTWTAAEAEEQLEGFKFIGPGWYVTDTETTLVVADVLLPRHSSMTMERLHTRWKQKWPASQKFVFYVYGGRNPFAAFDAIVNAPMRDIV